MFVSIFVVVWTWQPWTRLHIKYILCFLGVCGVPISLQRFIKVMFDW